MAATTAVYNFWLYELCDVFIVSSFLGTAVYAQLVVNSGSNETDDR